MSTTVPQTAREILMFGIAQASDQLKHEFNRAPKGRPPVIRIKSTATPEGVVVFSDCRMCRRSVIVLPDNRMLGSALINPCAEYKAEPKL
jgi:hypothetical protein